MIRNVFHYAKAVAPDPEHPSAIPWPDVPKDHFIEGSVEVGREGAKIIWHSLVDVRRAVWDRIKAHPKYLGKSYRELWVDHRTAAKHVILTEWTERGKKVRGTIASAPTGASGKFAPHRFGGLAVEE